jgi:nondiscriminating glutamyl-tRNA synthetase
MEKVNFMIRTRFAPSPTGFLHIGGARTALFNWLFAKKHRGQFILRIEDTDQERSQESYARVLYEDMEWLGLDTDENPVKGGSYGPYTQSHRMDIYSRYLQILKDKKAIYPCFCSPEQLREDRHSQLEQGLPPRYSGRCRCLSEKEIQGKILSGEKPCWRFAVPEKGVFILDDLVHGKIEYNYEEIGDFIVQRSDGWPTYLLSAALDDALMEISHVIRGDEHLINSVLQTLIQEALDLPSPRYGHVPMIVGMDRQKLSKRTGAQSVREYRERGFLPESLRAYLSTLSWTPENPLNLLSKDELIEEFSLSRIATSSPVHDEAHLEFWQKKAMAHRGTSWLFDELCRLAPDKEAFFRGKDRKHLFLLLEDISGACLTPSDVLKSLKWFFSPSALSVPIPEWIPEVARVLENINDTWESEIINKTLRMYQKEKGLKGREFYHPLRLLLTGEEQGPALPLEMAALGKTETLLRLARR